ncbi:MAG: bifunctional diaminohydroxyphosphoribosylaminopyrimidine deaminase/5-amino-6-(5-phosphoribosylamino)uracil reductase RibD [bacterium]|nr:bifunctional diaminohydroxyphosphoribosylaminopyrimidine deaminase/5-amino-6-(5-phosphoribosylamino)uracil reductase RibD [bacterium]
MTDTEYMQMALQLAAQGRGQTSPNPMVGAVVVKYDTVIGKGYHQRAGTPHAEIHALNDAGMDAHGSTLYVTLEPCSHKGRTLPCCDFIIGSKVARVVIAVRDPNPLVDGRGIAKLREAGIQVDVGILESEARELNEFFMKYITGKKPFVLLKAAVTLDGRIATQTGDSQWITGEASRAKGHEIRNVVDAILVGVNTVLKDNPRLTTRLPGQASKDPARIILDTHLRTPLDARVIQTVSTAPTVIVAGGNVTKERIRAYQDRNVTVLVAKKGVHRIGLKEIMEELARMEITSLLIEGGAEIHASALKEKIVDRVIFFIAPKLMGGGDSKACIASLGINRMDDVIRLSSLRTERVGEDVMIQGDVVQPDGLDHPVYAAGGGAESSTV